MTHVTHMTHDRGTSSSRVRRERTRISVTNRVELASLLLGPCRFFGRTGTLAGAQQPSELRHRIVCSRFRCGRGISDAEGRVREYAVGSGPLLIQVRSSLTQGDAFMIPKIRSSGRRCVHPSIDALEERTLLNGTMAHLDHRLRAPAEIFAAKGGHSKPIVPNLPAMPNSSVTTKPASGDVNPYGIAVVPAGFPGGGLIHHGQILVANFNDSANVQGTGTTIVAITPGQSPATAPVFFNSTAPGLTLGLSILKSGFVIVGNVPTTDGAFDTIGQGSLQIINRNGQLVDTLTSKSLLDGPWATAVIDHGNTAQLFVSSVLSGTVTRINFKVVRHHGQSTLNTVSMTQIASGYMVQPNMAAVVVGPGGLAYNSKNDTLYVASTADNEIFAIRHASRTHSDNGTGSVVYNDPRTSLGPSAWRSRQRRFARD